MAQSPLPQTPRRYGPNALAFAEQQAERAKGALAAATNKGRDEAATRKAIESHLAWREIAATLKTPESVIDDKVLADAALMLEVSVTGLKRLLRDAR